MCLLQVYKMKLIFYTNFEYQGNYEKLFLYLTIYWLLSLFI